MTALFYKINATDPKITDENAPGYFWWELTNAYKGMKPDDAQLVAMMSDGIAEAVAKNKDPKGELVVTLSSSVDSVDQAALTFTLKREDLSQAQIDVFVSEAARQFLGATLMKHKAKRAGWKPPKK